MSDAELHQRLCACLAEEDVLFDPDDRADFSVDIAGGEAMAATVVRPRDIEALCCAVRTATSLGYAIVPRGSGHSYTGGVVPASSRTVMVDLTALNHVLEIDTVNRLVRVEAGCTWATLADALAPHGLRTPFFGPLSGYRATVGGALSQGAAFFGSAMHGFSDRDVCGLTVVLADGDVLRTGHGGDGRPHPHVGGPDLNGLFLGDCGAFGIKAEVCLRLRKAPAVEVFASFTFSDMAPMLTAQAVLAGCDGLADCFGFDPESHANLARSGFTVIEGAEIVADLVRRKGGIRAASRLLRQGRAQVSDMRYSLHLVVEGNSDTEALERLSQASWLALDGGGQAVPDTIPRVTRSRPFRPIKALLGPDGERWLPVHGVFRLSDVLPAYEAAADLLVRHQADCARHGLRVSILTVTSGNAIVLEPQLFWPDALDRFHRRHATDEQIRRYQDRPARTEARAFGHRLRGELGAALRGAGAEHLQIGRYYPYEARLDPTMRRMLRSLKNALDPDGLMAPGVLIETPGGK